MNVMERSREIGVMRAIGASNGAIMRIVLVEGMLIGLISWALAIGLSVPTTSALNVGVGTAVLTMPMDFSFSLGGLIIWLGGALIVGAVASAWPAWNAMRMTVREVLAYE
jgi:putative ABC transport system permease protein